MGYGLPAALGVQIAHPDALVIDIAGDASIQMCIQEMSAAIQYEAPIKIFILNHQYMGMVRQWQTLYYGKRYSHTVLNDQVDFVKVAEGMGAKAYRVTNKEDFGPILKEAIELNIPVVIECQINSDDKVFPMVSPGAAIEDAFDSEDLKI